VEIVAEQRCICTRRVQKAYHTNTKHRLLTTREIQELWNQEKKQPVSIATIRRALKKTDSEEFQM
ncbi:16624_t:CDS:2, partial [Dentiscutata erythropus]